LANPGYYHRVLLPNWTMSGGGLARAGRLTFLRHAESFGFASGRRSAFSLKTFRRPVEVGSQLVEPHFEAHAIYFSRSGEGIDMSDSPVSTTRAASRVFVVGCRESGSLLRLLQSARDGGYISAEITAYDGYDLPHLDALCPDDRFILLVRDPRDVFAAGKRAIGWDFLTFRDEWERFVVHGLTIEASVGPTRAVQVKYEDLMATPRDELQKIFHFLGIEHVDELIASVRNEFRVSESHDERESLTQAEYDDICTRLHSPMKLLGYLSYEEDDRYSLRQLRNVAASRSESLKRQSVNSVVRRQRSPYVEPPSRHWTEISPVFIVGQGRSGTTLLRMMLSAHPKIFISSEGAYICPLRAHFSTYGELRDPRNLETLHADLLPWLEAVSFLNPPDVQDLIDWVDRFGCEERSLITFYGTWEARTLGKDGLAWWGDNEPSHVFNIPHFKELFPNSRFIVMVRDPRDVYASFKTAWPTNHTGETLAMLWERSLLDGLLAALRLGSGVVEKVRYEDLVMNPDAQLRQVCRFLDVEYTDAMMNFHESKAATNLSQVEHHRNLVQPVFRSSIGRYRHILDEAEIAAVTNRLYLPMACLGYLSEAEYQETKAGSRQEEPGWSNSERPNAF
jgi:Sulfotransferase family